jgi:hypothetical protein
MYAINSYMAATMNWKPISTFDYPSESFNYDSDLYLFYDTKGYPYIGKCIKYAESKYNFETNKGISIEPIYWLSIPNTFERD